MIPAKEPRKRLVWQVKISAAAACFGYYGHSHCCMLKDRRDSKIPLRVVKLVKKKHYNPGRAPSKGK